MSPPLPRVLFLDACVLYPAPTRDLFMRLALDPRLGIRLKWSWQVQEEWLSRLLEARGDLNEEQRKRLRRTPDLMAQALAFQEPLVEGYEHLVPEVDLPDPHDRHVVAAAYWGGAEAILTFNLQDFPEEALEPWDLVAIHPEAYLLELAEALIRIRSLPEPLLQILREQRGALKNPTLDTESFLEKLAGAGLRGFVRLLQPYKNYL
jgi:hypothetical protein